MLGLALAAGAAGLGGPVLAGCSAARGSSGPDPLIALADAARSDAALAAAAIATRPALTTRLEPWRAAREQHAAALEREIARLDPARASSVPAAPVVPPEGADLIAVRAATTRAAQQATDLVPTLPEARVGLVAAIAACCATYGGMFEGAAP